MRVLAITFVAFLLVTCSIDKKAMKAFRFGEYQKSIDQFKSVLKADPNNAKANYYIGEAYRLSNRVKASEPYYAIAAAGGEDINLDSAKLFYAKSLQANKKFDEAEEVLQSLAEGSRDRRLQARIQAEIDALERFKSLSDIPNYYKVKNLTALNTPYAEYAPSYLNNALYFTSSRSNKRIYEATGTPFSDLYKVVTQGAIIDTATIRPLPAIFNSDLVNEGCITFSPDGLTMIFAKGNTGKKNGNSDVDLFMSNYRRGEWTAPRPINLNLPNSWESTPAFSADGRTLYFSSNRRGGFGGLDVYAATMDRRGRFGRVRNLGASINTIGNELFPYEASNGQFYFSSDTHPGYGMLDIFIVKREEGKNVAHNLGKPVNSDQDDFGIFLFKPDRGFFTSNRAEGKGDDDIYTFVNEDPDLKVVNYTLEGVVYTLNSDSTRETLRNIYVSIIDESGDIMDEYQTVSDGAFSFRVYANENYTLMAEGDGYLVKRQPFTTIGKSIPKDSLVELVTNVTLDTLMILDPLIKNKVFVLQNIYFDYDSAVIRDDAAIELDKLVELLNDNPEIKIEMGSHTDSIASHSYNLELSQRRANSTVAYLISKGIPPERLEAKGYGESMPVANNSNPDGTDNPEGRAKNRRTEFKILEIGEVVRKHENLTDEDKYFDNDPDN